MSDSMYFPQTVEEFMESYKMVDSEEIYSNGIEYVPIFRMNQWFNENPNVINHDAKVRADAIEECIAKVDTLEQISFGIVATDLIKAILEKLKEQI